MDINTIKRKSVPLEIVDPVWNEPVGLRLHLISPKEPGPRKLAEQSADKQRAAERRNKPYSIKQQLQEAIRVNAACIIGWEWYEVPEIDYSTGEAIKGEDGSPKIVKGSMGGERPPYSDGKAEEILQRDFILEQVADQLRDEADFFDTSKPA